MLIRIDLDQKEGIRLINSGEQATNVRQTIWRRNQVHYLD